MAATLVLVAVARLRLLNFPLERDEGEYAYAGQLMLQGVPPYQLAFNMKFPGTYAGYALIMALFGETPAGIHLGLLLLTTATALMLFWLAKNLLDVTAGVVAATAYAVLAAGPDMLGLAGHATHFCAFFATAGLCAMWRARQTGKLRVTLAAGLLFGAAVLMKQHAALIALWAFLAWTVWRVRQRGIAPGQRLVSAAIFGAGVVLPFALCCLVLWRAGVFAQFWFWTIDYARQYAAVVPWDQAPAIFWRSFARITPSGIPLWLTAGTGLALLWREDRLRGARWWLLGFFVASAASVCPDLYFRVHYFLIALPAVALMAAVAVSVARRRWTGRQPFSRLGDWPAWGYALLVAITIVLSARIWFVLPIPQIIRGTCATDHVLYGADPLPEAEMVAQYLRENSPDTARVAVLGSEPEIYFLAHRRSATGYIYIYGQMEPQPFALQMQRNMIGGIEAQKPEFIVFADNQMSWNKRPDSNPTIFHWWDQYQTNYTLVGMTDIISPTNTIVVLGTNFIARYPTAHGSALEIYRRK